MKVKLQHVAHARSGDKGDTSNIAVFASITGLSGAGFASAPGLAACATLGATTGLASATGFASTAGTT